MRLLTYLARRLVLAVFTVCAISVLSFVIIQLPPGDYVTAYIAQMAASGTASRPPRRTRCAWPTASTSRCGCSTEVAGDGGQRQLRQVDGVGRPVTEVIGDRLWLTICCRSALVFTWVLALPIGIYSAVRQYSVGDYVFTFIGFIGLAMPNFLLALMVLYFGSPAVRHQHRRPVLRRAAAGAVELGQGRGPAGAPADPDPDPGAGRHRAAGPHHARQPAGRTAQALRGHGRAPAACRRRRVILKYPVRVALNPFASTIGYTLPYIVSGSDHRVDRAEPADGRPAAAAVADRAGHVPGRTIILLLGVLTVIGTLLSDLLLMWIDPRIRLEA